MNISESLTAKVGPLPVWAWSLAGVVGLRGISWWRARQTPAAEPAAEPAAGTDTPASAYPANYDAGVPAIAPLNPTPSTSTTTVSLPPTAPAYVDNDAWRRAAIDALIARGVPATEAVEAISAYLAGEPISGAQEAMVNTAANIIGQPPAPPATISRRDPVSYVRQPRRPVEPSPPTAPEPAGTPAQPSSGTYTIRSGDTLVSVARARYGTASLDTLNKLAALNGLTWNAAHTSVTPFRVGQVLTLPATL